MYQDLKPEKIVQTTQVLCNRIAERFPDSGLRRVANEVLLVAEKAAETSEFLARPHVPLRIGVTFLIAVIFMVALGAMFSMDLALSFDGLSDFVQAVESAINDIVFIGIAVFFLTSWETRIKRNRVLKALRRLRSLAHIIDMHQLTKDPERILNAGPSTSSSPRRTMTAFELTRYLDYCSEMLSIISKIGSIYIQHFDDSVTLQTVNDIENVTNGLSRKIWQKIIILDRIVQSETSPELFESTAFQKAD